MPKSRPVHFLSGESPPNLFHLQILVGEDNVVDRGENAKQRLECLKELHNWGGMVPAHLRWAGLIINISLLNAQWCVQLASCLPLIVQAENSVMPQPNLEEDGYFISPLSPCSCNKSGTSARRADTASSAIFCRRGDIAPGIFQATIMLSLSTTAKGLPRIPRFGNFN